jgi:hypothetical protein
MTKAGMMMMVVTVVWEEWVAVGREVVLEVGAGVHGGREEVYSRLRYLKK